MKGIQEEDALGFRCFNTSLKTRLAVGAVLSFYPVQVLVERDVTCVDLSDEVSLLLGEGVPPLNVGFQWELVVKSHDAIMVGRVPPSASPLPL